MMGSVAPSSRYLANALCRYATEAQYLVELGAGTGAITQHLHSNFPEVPLVAVERDLAMAAALAHRLPECSVVAGCLHDRPDLLLGLPEESVIVSSLPFLSLPEEVSKPTIALIRDFLLKSPRRKLLQYTYGRKEPFDPGQQSLSWQRQELVLRNLPPAWVWALKKSVWR
ncbi:MAG: hypothetical protein ABI476_05100 [Oxalobacteraceae bacterium]